MDVGMARPALPSYTAITPVAKALDRIEPAAATELPASQTVSPMEDLEASNRAADDAARRILQIARDLSLDRNNKLDPESRSVIYVATDSETGEIVRQIPTETVRKLRAYSVQQQELDSSLHTQPLERTA
ncbi:hypothetical protein [Roseibium sp. RKSG952]|uniref:hypothetical protein n=1 Tax=Roseibium sp. RKSG952 TaxID=2529384 RepID=UPI0012BD4746|nr:hypothetical protein [Roseibium sp. RKSG952]MTH97615.1 hypothetical protein [Roseibium sp. RKSG952]